MAITMRQGVFISYSRADEAYAKALRARLEREHPELKLWRDREETEGGRSWWAQIEDALQHVEYMVLLASPDSMQSEMVRKEWRYARQQGVCIYPVKVPGSSLEPRWMRDVHFSTASPGVGGCPGLQGRGVTGGGAGRAGGAVGGGAEG